jgi:hypothetical protein
MPREERLGFLLLGAHTEILPGDDAGRPKDQRDIRLVTAAYRTLGTTLTAAGSPTLRRNTRASVDGSRHLTCAPCTMTA